MASSNDYLGTPVQSRPKYAMATDWADSDYADGPAPADCQKLLNRASTHIAALTRNAVYECDEEGYPVELGILEALRDATIAQAAFWLETGDTSGAAAGMGHLSIGSLGLGGVKSAGDTPRSKQISRHAPEAIEILDLAGLHGSAVGRR
jgi:hypothetical protein